MPNREISQSELKVVGTFIAGAYGDALGWPNESRARTKSKEHQRDPFLLYPWLRRGGGRFQAFEEQIDAGTYSDDTQLSIASARARLTSSQWWTHLASVELPFWTIYQQGGGGATNRAAKLLLKGTLPWQSAEQDRRRYFDAGGNGVAMRVAAHCIAHRKSSDFSLVARDVFTDGVLTHGHPAALVGALAFSFALWSSLRVNSTLAFGELIERTLEFADQWTMVPEIEDRWPDWLRSALETTNFWHHWSAAVADQVRMLEIASEAMKLGALSVDFEILREIGCFDPGISGAGTVAAAAAIYLASRYAASPVDGLLQAATAKGADTDTLASMTGNLLGSINGANWLPVHSRIQDLDLLRRLAVGLDNGEVWETSHKLAPVRAASLRALLARLSHESRVVLPHGVEAEIIGRGNVVSKTSTTVIDSWVMRDDWGQTFLLRRTVKTASTSEVVEQEAPQLETGRQNDTRARVAGVCLHTRDLLNTKSFYSQVIGLSLLKDAPDLIQFGQNLVFRRSKSAPNGAGTVIYLEVDDIDAVWQRTKSNSVRLITELDKGGARARFACYDPDGRRLEVFAALRE